MKTSRLLAIVIAGGLAGTTLLAALPASADSRLRQQEVRQLRESGKILPMEDILARARKAQPGQVVEVELERDGDRYVYEVKLIDQADKVHELKLDAGNGEVLRRKEK
ncbi:PepSY domain-containing protein [Burkholderiaceae bacterium FT117]|uniref:PepSY domain-containing protein n=1 Tax=Zeimonas sediminis TaxID=2944268 RepID=UPI002342FCC1|nr:PepSY domain-containing protein [Zeimonas sediminis]MCM5570152.1 PepSY domain-containing protein [Zeimonas sediminis]